MPANPGLRLLPPALRRRKALERWLAWVFPAVTVVTTVAFFVLMTAASPLLTHASFAGSINRGMLVAVAILLAILCGIWTYARIASAIENSEDGPIDR